MNRALARVAFLHPAWLTLAFFSGFVGALLFGSAVQPVDRILPLAILFAPTLLGCVWMHGIYRACRVTLERRGGPELGRDFGWIFVVAELTVLAVPAFGAWYFATDSSPWWLDYATAPFMFCLFATFWLPAEALARFEHNGRPPTIGQTLLKLIAFFYWPFGAWAIRGALSRLKTELGA